uniref:Ovule protein n=1 Tax=Heterorhabditis bacteriophora TaxID=37862 RepID=A0A1I7WPL0_HETBA
MKFFYCYCLPFYRFMALYTNCIYFTMWKSYDLLWFWMHLTLCSCFNSLRRENYLVVWCNLIWKKRTQYENHTFKVFQTFLYFVFSLFLIILLII